MDSVASKRGAAVRLENVRFTYGQGAFSLGVDELVLEAGVHAACIGPSGSGKTTLINLIAGILQPDRGRVMLGDTEVTSLDDAGRRALRIERIGMVFQRFELLDYLSSEENILLPYHISAHLTLDREAKSRARELAAAMGIEHTLARRPRRLSQGERQRVAICRALVNRPELVIADEPTGNLDAASANATLDLLFEEVTSRGATLMVVTHDAGLLPRFDRVIDVTQLSGAAV